MDTVCKEQVVALRTVYYVCRSFDSLLEKTLGPNGKSTLLSTATGQIAITNVGYTVLRCMNIGHPLATMIAKSIASHHSYAGDGSKTFVLYLTNIFSSIVTSVEEKLGVCESDHRTSLLNAVHHIRNELFNNILLPAVHRNCSVTDICESKCATMTLMHNLVKSHLCGKYTETIRSHLSHLLVDFLCSGLSDFQSLSAEISVCIDNFNLLCIDVDCMLPLSSNIYEGIIIQRDFLNFNHCASDCSHTRFILLHNSFTKDGCKSEVSSTLEAKDISSLDSIFLWKSQCSAALVDWLQRNNVNLILSTGSIDDTLYTLCSKAGILMVQFIDMEDFVRLKILFQITALEFISDLFEVKSDDCIGCAEVCEAQVFGQKRFVCLKLREQHHTDTLKMGLQTACGYDDSLQIPKKVGVYPKCLKRQLVICAMSSGACQQIRLDLLHALKVLRLWLDSKCLNNKFPHSSAVHIAGGGSFELTCHSALQDYLKQNALQLDVPVTVCCEALCAALLAVPLRLLHNSFQQRLATVLYVKEMIKSSKASGANMYGFDGHNGCQLPADTTIVEPLMSKILLLDHVLQLTEQLLRIDSLICVKRLVQQCSSEGEIS